MKRAMSEKVARVLPPCVATPAGLFYAGVQGPLPVLRLLVPTCTNIRIYVLADERVFCRAPLFFWSATAPTRSQDAVRVLPSAWSIRTLLHGVH